MKFLSVALVYWLNCTHYVPVYFGPNWELSEFKKYDRHADMCLMLERMQEVHQKERRFFHKKNMNLESDGFSMYLDCM